MHEENSKIRTYNAKDSIVFAKTDELFGGLSNMAPGFPLFINDNIILTAEALYQAMRYPLFPDIQQQIIIQNSPMTAKMISKKYQDKTRQDWDEVRVKIMRWVLEVKLSQNWNKFSVLLKETGNKSIVEYSTKDQFWGAQKNHDDGLVGTNALGRLLMELREKYVVNNCKPGCIPPVNITGLMLFGHELGTVCNEDYFIADESSSELEYV
jgi:ribA/ribD-fused uncharacterized protein